MINVALRERLSDEAVASALGSASLFSSWRVRASRRAAAGGDVPSLVYRMLSYPLDKEDGGPETRKRDRNGALKARDGPEWGREALKALALSATMLRSWGYPLPATPPDAEKALPAALAAALPPVSAPPAEEGGPLAAGLFAGSLADLEASRRFLAMLTAVEAGAASELAGAACYETLPSPPGEKVLSVAAIDCEMCDTAAGLELTRLSVVDGLTGQVVLDCLVKPYGAITDYRERFSGLNAASMNPVETRLEQVQAAVLGLVGADTALIGHSLENDLKALRLVHRFCIDTAHLFPHPRGYPCRQKLSRLAQDYLGLQIQQQRGAAKGHDSVEDARTALQLVQAKVRHGPGFGMPQRDKRFNRRGLFSEIESDVTDASPPAPSSFRGAALWIEGAPSAEFVRRAADGSAADLVSFPSWRPLLQRLSDALDQCRKRSQSAQEAARCQVLCVADVCSKDAGEASDIDILTSVAERVYRSEPAAHAEQPTSSSFAHSVVFVVVQKPLEPVLDLQRLRQACSQPRATRPWTSEQERQLRDLALDTNCGKVFMKII